MRGAETMAWSRHQQVARGYLGNAPPPRIRFFTNSKKSEIDTCTKHDINTVDAITFPIVLAATPRAI